MNLNNVFINITVTQRRKHMSIIDDDTSLIHNLDDRKFIIWIICIRIPVRMSGRHLKLTAACLA